jgi:hypothetical protein
MGQAKFNAENDFLVKESAETNLIISIIFFIIFFIAVYSGDFGWEVYSAAIGIFLLRSAYYLNNARKKEAFIRINKTGFYYKGSLITAWNNFVEASIKQDEIPGSINDNFVLIIQYYSGYPLDLYVYKIPLTNTQDKADEEILEAIQFYYNETCIT